jgi:hypothetical protein
LYCFLYWIILATGFDLAFNVYRKRIGLKPGNPLLTEGIGFRNVGPSNSIARAQELDPIAHRPIVMHLFGFNHF